MSFVRLSKELGLDRETEGCGATEITFVNLPVPDRSVPSDTDDFLHAVEQLAQLVREGQFVGVHCRASIGRSSVLAVSVLVRLGWDANEAFDAVESARGCSIPDTPEQRQCVDAVLAEHRINSARDGSESETA